MKEYSLNQDVYVRLNMAGKEELKRQEIEVKRTYPHLDKDFTLMPKEDENGWSKWQFHTLMTRFGHILHNGCFPFEPTIRLED